MSLLLPLWSEEGLAARLGLLSPTPFPPSRGSLQTRVRRQKHQVLLLLSSQREILSMLIFLLTPSFGISKSQCFSPLDLGRGI